MECEWELEPPLIRLQGGCVDLTEILDASPLCIRTPEGFECEGEVEPGAEGVRFGDFWHMTTEYACRELGAVVPGCEDS